MDAYDKDYSISEAFLLPPLVWVSILRSPFASVSIIKDISSLKRRNLMPGYYNWKIRNCPQGALSKANSLLETVEEIEPYLQKMWDDGNGSFTEKVNKHLSDVVAHIDEAEEKLEAAKLKLAELFPGHPE